MHDPFPIPSSPLLSKLVTPFSEYTGLVTLPIHIHEVFLSFIGYTAIQLYFAPWISAKLFPVRYNALDTAKRLNWDVHVVSLVQSSLINFLALYIMFADEERKNMNSQERIFGYTGGAGMIQGLAAGYFLWDLVVTLQNLKVFGFGMLAHALSALTVFSFGFRPFVNYYGCTFILYELSSPFLNFHWFFDKLNMTGSKPQLYNGIALLFTFFCCRLVWGTYQSVRVYQDVWTALHLGPLSSRVLTSENLNTTAAALGKSAEPIQNEIMKFAGDEVVPVWLAMTYLGSNIVLNTLNFFWFNQMIKAVRKRFVAAPKKEQVGTVESGANGSVKIGASETEVRRRRKA